MNIQKINIKDLKAAEYNPRRKLKKTDEAYKRIKASIEEFGCVDPIIVNSKNMTIIGGHQRLEVLRELGFKEIECVLVNLNEKQEKRLNLSLNKNAGYWDNLKLEELFDELQLDEEELLATGFDMSEIEDLKTDFISDLLEEDFITTDRELDKFAVTFNISKEYEEKFSNYLKQNGKENLIQVMIDEVERM